MKTQTPNRPWLLLGILAALAAAPSQAQLFRAYLASDGNDANACTLQQPCRLLPAALAAVASGGEIWMLDSANFNVATVNVTKSVTILAIPGAVGSVVAVGGPAISIATAGVNVALRNLVIVPLAGAGGTSGIVMTLGTSLGVDSSLLAGLPSSGIAVLTPARVRIADTVIRNVGNYSVQLEAGATTEIVGSRISGSSNLGISTYSNTASVATRTSISDTTVSGTSNCGVFSNVGGMAGAQALSFLTRVTVTGSAAGVCVQGGPSALLTLTGSTVQGNEYGVYFTTATSIVKSFGNNVISDNLYGDVMGGGTITAAALL